MRLVHFLTTKGFVVGIIASTIVSCKVLESPQNTKQVDPIDKIIASMSIEEKVGQTCQVTLDVILQPATTGGDQTAKIDTASLKEALITYKVGSVLNVGSHTLSRAEWSTVINAVKAPYNSGRIKIPVIYGIDAIHGMNYTVGGTLFPQEIGLAATWNKALVEACASTTAYEVRASGIPWNFSPVLDLGRQPLWSRHFETLGEDPYLCSELGAAMIKGYQGKDGVDQEHVAACMKHFVGYSAATSGRDRTPAWIPSKYMRELYLPSFEKAVKAGALTVMINSGVVNGIPGHINKYLLTDVLKKEMGFDGFAVSDWEDFIMLHTVHRTSETLEKAYVAAFNAGVDMSMVPLSPQYKEYCSVMINAVKRGDISMERLDDAVRRILRVKMKVGLFEKDEYNPEAFKEFGSEAFKKKALDAALESITLLKNSADILPLDKKKKVLVAGPVADNLVYLNGAWTHTWQGVDQSYNTPNRPTVKQAFEAYLGKENVLYAQGAELILKDGFETTTLLDTADYRSKLAQCDVVVLCLGEMPSTEKPGDIHSLNMDREQMLLAEMAYKMKKSVVLVLLEGRPRIIRDIVDQASAIIQCYLPGDFGAEALVKLAYGEHNFSGKLPYTYPKYDGVIEFYDHPRSVDRSKSGDFKAYDPQWDFGHGLSYSNVTYSPLTLSKNEMKGKESLTVAVKVSNVSTRKVHEIIQLYVTDEFATLVPAGKRLRRFEKVELLPGQTKEVSFELNDQDLIFYDNQERPQIEPGKFTLSIKEQNISFIYTE
jgi:beta-glucosidase